MASIELKNVTKVYEGFKALDALNLTVPSGSVYGLIGPNGAGKTTAIRHMMGVLRQDAGSVLLDGEPVFENPAVKARMLCIPDEPYYTSTSTTRDLMKFTRAIYPRFDTQRYEKLREIFTLDDTRPIRRLSRGMQKQSAFWIALAARPEVLVLDEPVDGLDPVMRRQVWSLVMEDVAEEGTTVLVSSHNLRELEDVCDHVGIMQRGRCLLEKSVSELQETTTKVLLALPDGAALPAEGLDILHRSSTGKLQTLILRGREEDNLAWLEKLHPLFMDSVPLTLEEIYAKIDDEDWNVVWIEGPDSQKAEPMCPYYKEENKIVFCAPPFVRVWEETISRYGKSWRCWPRKPTPEQMAAEKWEE